MTANEAKIIEFMSSTGPMTHGESSALIELFRDKSHRLDLHTRVEIGQAIRQPYQERVARLRELSLRLEDALDDFSSAQPRMTPEQREAFTALSKYINAVTNYVDEMM
ncbi:MAG: hypothetical protein EBU84_19720 [Actinobacteria bacterium]|nr:hypothetical protein [Actinomycetota bacterium]